MSETIRDVTLRLSIQQQAAKLDVRAPVEQLKTVQEEAEKAAKVVSEIQEGKKDTAADVTKNVKEIVKARKEEGNSLEQLKEDYDKIFTSTRENIEATKEEVVATDKVTKSIGGNATAVIGKVAAVAGIVVAVYSAIRAFEDWYLSIEDTTEAVNRARAATQKYYDLLGEKKVLGGIKVEREFKEGRIDELEGMRESLINELVSARADVNRREIREKTHQSPFGISRRERAKSEQDAKNAAEGIAAALEREKQLRTDLVGIARQQGQLAEDKLQTELQGAQHSAAFNQAQVNSMESQQTSQAASMGQLTDRQVGKLRSVLEKLRDGEELSRSELRTLMQQGGPEGQRLAQQYNATQGADVLQQFVDEGLLDANRLGREALDAAREAQNELNRTVTEIQNDIRAAAVATRKSVDEAKKALSDIIDVMIYFNQVQVNQANRLKNFEADLIVGG